MLCRKKDKVIFVGGAFALDMGIYKPRPRKRFFGVHSPDSPAYVHVVTETNTSHLIFD